MQCWKDHQYVLGHIALPRSEECLKLQSVQRIPAVPKHERDTIFNEYFPQTDPVDPNAQPAMLLRQQAQDARWWCQHRYRRAEGLRMGFSGQNLAGSRKGFRTGWHAGILARL